MTMTAQDYILNFLKVTGPVLPTKVANHIHENIIIASAHLSDLVSQRKVRISNLKVGGSPLYYLPGQEGSLYDFASGNINPKDHQVLENLKANLMLRENDLDTLSKVALRNLRDFAVPIQVTINNKRELFWRWHLLKDDETNRLLNRLISGPPVQEEEPTVPAAAMAPAESIAKPVELQPAVTLSEEKAENKLYLSKAVETEAGLSKTESKVESPVNKIKEHKTAVEQKAEHQTVLPEKAKKTLLKRVQEKILGNKSVPDTFMTAAEEQFKRWKIVIEEKTIIRKKAELDFIVKVPSVVGETTYFCKAKNKKRCDEKDLSTAYMEAQIKKLPLLFLYSEELNKKAQEMLKSDAFKNAVVKKIE